LKLRVCGEEFSLSGKIIVCDANLFCK